MSNLHAIIHPKKQIEEKVNFFADYYKFVVSEIGRSDYLTLENNLSIVDKILFQIDTNLEHCTKYIDSYLTHPLIQKDNKHFKEEKYYESISSFFEEYKKIGKPKARLDWIKSNPKFTITLRKYRTYLKRFMFKGALKAIISFLKCNHEISIHKDDLIHYTNTIVSELILNNRVKTDATKVFSKIITNDIKDFPFPKSILRKNKHRLEAAKEEFIKSRTFDQQFEGIYNYFKETPKNEYFIYRIYGLRTKDNFSFKYNKVTFYNPKHLKLINIVNRIKKQPFFKNFLDREDVVLAVVKVNFHSKKIGELTAINLISKELMFLDFVCKSNSYFEKYTYLTTSNFNDLGWRWNTKEKGSSISDGLELKDLNNNPYKFLIDINIDCRNHFLNFEPLYVNAITTRSPEDYWRYLETLIPLKLNGEKQVLDVVTSLLLNNADGNEGDILKSYIINSIAPMNTSASILNLTSEKQMQFFNQLQNEPVNLNFEEIKKEINHPFINYLFKEKMIPAQTKAKIELKKHYKSVLIECYGQRNSILHSSLGNEKALLLIDNTLPKLVTRLRWVLFDGMRKYKDLNFEALIKELIKDSDLLLNSK